LAFFLLDPHPKMPNLQLTRSEASDIAAYISTLRSGRIRQRPRHRFRPNLGPRLTERLVETSGGTKLERRSPRFLLFAVGWSSA
jgi:hypothetical protein